MIELKDLGALRRAHERIRRFSAQMKRHAEKAQRLRDEAEAEERASGEGWQGRLRDADDELRLGPVNGGVAQVLNAVPEQFIAALPGDYIYIRQDEAGELVEHLLAPAERWASWPEERPEEEPLFVNTQRPCLVCGRLIRWEQTNVAMIAAEPPPGVP
jgi:hypothetical protein